jgi:phthalate 4,5-dioxygenase reductase subunit
MTGAPLMLALVARRRLAERIDEFTFADPGRAPLPTFTAGAHATFDLGDGVRRSYSMSGDPSDTRAYTVAVQLEEDGRGGSRRMHALELGTQVTATPPVNAFPLAEDATGPATLVAGGIGITPLVSMIRRLEATERQYRLVYCTRDPAHTAYAAWLSEPARTGEVLIHHDRGRAEAMLDLAAELAVPPPGGHLYCCGPAGLMDGVRAAAAHWPEGHVHFESFSGTPVGGERHDFEVEIASTGQMVGVGHDETILDALRDAGLEVDSSCESGTCGTCQTRYLEGDVAHEDFVLMDDERETHLMICVSRARSGRLKLDL